MFRNGQAEKARILLEHGINVHEIQNQGWNALHLAVRYGGGLLYKKKDILGSFIDIREKIYLKET